MLKEASQRLGGRGGGGCWEGVEADGGLSQKCHCSAWWRETGKNWMVRQARQAAAGCKAPKIPRPNLIGQATQLGWAHVI